MSIFPRRTTPMARLVARPNVPEPTDHHTASHTNEGNPVWGHLQAPAEIGSDLQEDTPIRREKCLRVNPDSPNHLPLACGDRAGHGGLCDWARDTGPLLDERRRAEIATGEAPCIG